MFSQDPYTVDTGEEIFPLVVGYLPEKFRIKAEVELNYTTNVREETLRELKDRISDDGDLKSCRIQDTALMMFLNCGKYDVGKALNRLKKYIAFRKKNLDMFTNINIENLIPLLEVMTPLPLRCQDGCTLFLFDLEKWKFESHPVELVKQMFVITLTMCLLEPMSQANGYKVIYNLNVTTDILKLGTPTNLYRLYYGSQHVLPVRLKEIHFVNMGKIGRATFQLIKIFYSEKLLKRFHIHATPDSLLKHFPKEVIPRKFGGDLIDYDMTSWLEKVTSPKELSVLEVD